MKKTLSLILAVMMLLGCMSITVFAGGHEPGVVIAGTTLTADGIVSNTAITSGTVTYTAASDGNPAKLILNNAVISGPCEAPIISVYDINLVIELIGNNRVTAGSNDAVISMNTELTITGSGSLIIHGNGGEGSVAIVVKGTGGITLSEGCKMVGSTSATETVTVIDTMSEVTFDADEKTYMVGEAVAQTVAIYNSNAASGKSGNTDITLTVAKALTYDMVIPEDVTNLNAAGIYSVGQAKATNVKNATDKTVISYTAETTAFKCEGKNDIPASYYTEQAATNAFPTDAVTVYENKAEAASIPTMWVKIAEDDWNAAENGTYTATVTFNFSAEEVEKVTIADILPEGFPTSAILSAWQNNAACYLFVSGDNLCAKGGAETSVPVATVLTPTSGDYDYTCTVSDITWNFSVGENEFWRVNISGFTGGDEELNGTYGIPR